MAASFTLFDTLGNFGYTSVDFSSLAISADGTLYTVGRCVPGNTLNLFSRAPGAGAWTDHGPSGATSGITATALQFRGTSVLLALVKPNLVYSFTLAGVATLIWSIYMGSGSFGEDYLAAVPARIYISGDDGLFTNLYPIQVGGIPTWNPLTLGQDGVVYTTAPNRNIFVADPVSQVGADIYPSYARIYPVVLADGTTYCACAPSGPVFKQETLGGALSYPFDNSTQTWVDFKLDPSTGDLYGIDASKRIFTLAVPPLVVPNEVYKDYTLVVDYCVVPNEVYKDYTITVHDCSSNTLYIDETAFNLCYGSLFYHALVTSGGIAPYAYSIQSGSLPPSLTLEDNTIVGVPSSGGTFEAVIRVIDSMSATADFTITFEVGFPLSLDQTTIQPIAPDVPYSQQLVIDGLLPGEGSVTINTAQLPPGLSYDEGSNTISGTAIVQTGVYNVDAVITYNGCVQLDSFGLFVYGLVLPPTSLCVMPSVPFYYRLRTSNGVAPFAWSVVGDPLPDYLVLNPTTGEITGSSATEQVVYTSVRVEDGLGSECISDLTLQVSSLCSSTYEQSPDYPPTASGRAPWIPSLQSKATIVAARYFEDNLINFLPTMYTE